MPICRLRIAACAIMILALLAGIGTARADPPPASRARVEAALSNIRTLVRLGRDALATVWDGNKYIQCRRMPDNTLRCEAAGAMMQSSLARVLLPARVARLEALGWRLDNSFGNYVQSFPADMPAGEIADRLMQALAEGYDANLAELEVLTDWVHSEECPPRNGPSQNLAGMINDSPAMARYALYTGSYAPGADEAPGSEIASAAELIKIYGGTVTAEVQRLRVNSAGRFFFVLDIDAGYVQCRYEPKEFYCEAQSTDSWEALARILTPERVARLHAAGFADPGRAPNYWKTYSADTSTDKAIADELLTILHDVYGYDGRPKLKIKTEMGRS